MAKAIKKLIKPLTQHLKLKDEAEAQERAFVEREQTRQQSPNDSKGAVVEEDDPTTKLRKRAARARFRRELSTAGGSSGSGVAL